jgi:L-iditol 2-dehydrogenase
MIPETMKAAVLHGIHDLRIENVPVPKMGPDEVLVRIRACGLCTSDVHYYHKGRIGSYIVTGPMIVGHEVAGDVVAIGSAVTNVAVGTRVAVEAGVTCGRCQWCKTGRYNLCPDIVFYATPPYDGAMAEYAVIRSDFAHPLPDHATYEQGALCEPISVSIHCANLTRMGSGDTVVILGAGPIGLTGIVTARGRGARQVIVTDVLPGRLEVARRLGAIPVDVRSHDAREVVMDLTGGRGADILWDSAGVRSALEAAPALMRKGGAMALIAPIDEPITFNLFEIQNAELAIYGIMRYANTYPAAIALVSSGLFPTDELITDRRPLEDAVSAFEQALEHKDKVVKIIINP